MRLWFKNVNDKWLDCYQIRLAFMVYTYFDYKKHSWRTGKLISTWIKYAVQMLVISNYWN